MSIATWEELRSDWSRLQAFYGQVRGAAANATIPEEAWGGINNTFTLCARNIARLSVTGDYGKGVIDGTVSPAEWAELANITAQALKGILVTFNEEDLFARAWSEVIVPTAREARDVAASAFDSGMSALTLVVIGLALIVALKVIR